MIMIPKNLFERNGHSKELIRKFLIRLPRVYLFLDYDGTLTPIKNNPSSAVLSNSIKNLLVELNQNKYIKVFIVTGRSYKTLKDLSGLKNIPIASNHGFHINSEKIKWSHPVIKKIIPHLTNLTLLLKEQLKLFKGVLIEDKGITISIHYRNVNEKSVPLIKEVILKAVKPYSGKLKITYGKKIIEVRPAVEWNKGLAVLKILKLLKLKTANPVIFYMGDDLTDEDAFKILKNKAVTIRVGKSSLTNAKYLVKDTNEVHRLLRSINSIYKERNEK